MDSNINNILVVIVCPHISVATHNEAIGWSFAASYSFSNVFIGWPQETLIHIMTYLLWTTD